DAYPIKSLLFKDGSLSLQVRVGAIEWYHFTCLYDKEYNDFRFSSIKLYEDDKVVEDELKPSDFFMVSETLKGFRLENLFIY
ncbi:MAG: hypothetical protein AAFQ37_11160, partial [Bacteroidota bacterium]